MVVDFYNIEKPEENTSISKANSNIFKTKLNKYMNSLMI